VRPVPVVLAALRPRMLELAAQSADGAHPCFVPVEHTRRARVSLGPDRLLAPELMVLIEPDASRAREVARATTASYLALTNYAESLRSLGYAEADVVGAGSDRLVDDIVAWGTPQAIRERVQEHLAAGADHVAIQPLGSFQEQRRQLRMLAPLLKG
jgi:probable F420-dependent oxidoreductase